MVRIYLIGANALAVNSYFREHKKEQIRCHDEDQSSLWLGPDDLSVSRRRAPRPTFQERIWNRFNRDWFKGFILLFVISLAYQPVWYAGFIWDDYSDIIGNPAVIGPHGLKAIWTTNAAQFYPLTLTIFWLEHALWGSEPLGYHLVNVLIHGACAILLWQVLRNLRVPGAWLGATLWALHPVEVESVAWVAETKNTLSAFFYLLTIFLYLKGLNRGQIGYPRIICRNQVWLLLSAALAMASKSSTVTLPIVLCLSAWWLEGKWHWNHLVRVAPIFLFSIVSSDLALWTVQLQGVNADPFLIRSWMERLGTVGYEVWFYLSKLLWPFPLIAIYPRWQVDDRFLLTFLPLFAVVVVLLILWRYRLSWSRPYLFVFTYFLIALFPVLGLINHNFLRYSYVADHYQYLADMAPLALAGVGLTTFGTVIFPERAWARSAFCAAFLIILGLLTWSRAWAYQSEEKLWQYTLDKNPRCWKAHDSLGLIDLKSGNVDQAISHFQKSMEISSMDPIAPADLGAALLMKGRVDEAIEQYKSALAINPRIAAFHLDLGTALLTRGKIEEALPELRKAVEIDSTYAKGHHYLGVALEQKGQWAEAIIEFQKVLRLKPDNVQDQNYLQEAMAHQDSAAQ